MKKFFHMTKDTLRSTNYQIPNHPIPSSCQPTANLPPTSLDVLRYRSHHGVNLGSIFVLEKWLFPSMFEPGVRGDSELDAVTASIAAHGVEATRQRWEEHWASALTDDEIVWLVCTAGLTSLRLPIGYFTLGPAFTGGTPFAGHIAQVYGNAWSAVRQLCERLYSAGIGVLLDFHALPGNANTEDHGGVSTKKAELWGNKSNLSLGKKCLLFMAEEVKKGSIKGCLGIELCNEACWGAKGMYEWYSDVVSTIGQVDVSIPIYISDAWDLGSAMAWCRNMNKRGAGNPIGVDTHRYYTFTDKDKSQSPRQIIERVRIELDEVAVGLGDVTDKGAVQVIVGEWSCCMTEDSWARAGGVDKDDLVRQFGKAETEQWSKKGGGAFFWTAKMEWMDGGEWGLFEMVKRGAVLPSANLTMPFEEVKIAAERARRQRLDRKKQAVDAHVCYWDSTAPGGQFEHWRFEQGWDLGFADAMAFFELRASGNMQGARNGGDVIGVLELWVMKRLCETGQVGGFAWEWEHGFRQGVGQFRDSVLVTG